MLYFTKMRYLFSLWLKDDVNYIFRCLFRTIMHSKADQGFPQNLAEA